MSSVTTQPLDLSHEQTPQVQARPSRPRGRAFGFIWRAIVATFKYLLGVIACLSPLTSVLVVGWTYRLMQRSAFRGWYRRSGLREQGMSFADFATSDERTAAHTHWPNWIVRRR